MSIYQLERDIKHEFFYVERDTAFNPKTGAMGGYLPSVRCFGVAYNEKNSRVIDRARDGKGLIPQNYNDWVFLVRSKWLPAVVAGNFFVYDGFKYEIADYTKIEDGYAIDCRSTKQPMTITRENLTLDLDLTVGATGE